MKERPILFSSAMVRAILDNRKTQTRRVVKLTKRNVLGPDPGKMDCDLNPDSWRVENMPIPPAVRCENLLVPIWHSEEKHLWDGAVERVSCPYGWAGEDRLWVRETHQWRLPNEIRYQADDARRQAPKLPTPITIPNGKLNHWRPSIFMPRWASRITLEIVSVRVERLQDISDADVLAEGCTLSDPRHAEGHEGVSRWWNYRELWDSINGQPRKGKPDVSWAANCFVWVISFRRITS